MYGQGGAADSALAARDGTPPTPPGVVPLAAPPPGPGTDYLGWPSPVPLSADDNTGTTWHVRRAWPVRTPGDYVLEVLTRGRPGVRGARLRRGRFKLIPPDDPRLPALRAEAQQGEVISYRPYRRAVVRAEGRYIKIFLPGRAVVPADLCAQIAILLDAGNFTTPRILLRSSPDVIVFSSIPGQTLNELGRREAAVSDEAFASAWEKWSRAWVAQLSRSYGPAAQSVLNSLPLRSAEAEAADVWRRVNGWLRHNENVPQLSSQRDALRAAAEQVTMNLLRTSPDPLVWAHGDLHDKQIIATEDPFPPGLLDFDSTARAEAARDLADLDVHLELQLRQNCLTAARYLAAHTQVLAAAEELHVSPDRFQAYSDAIWLRLASSPLPGRFSLGIAVLADRAQALSSVITTRIVDRPTADVDARSAGRVGVAQDQETETAGRPRQATAGEFPEPGITPARRFQYSFSPLFFSAMSPEWSELWMYVLRAGLSLL
jgi:hypothetical protein